VAKAAAAQQQQQQQQQQRVTSQREARRETAKRSRQRKKFVVQSLETLRGDMERRNTALAAAVVAHLPSEIAQRVLEQDASQAGPLPEPASPLGMRTGDRFTCCFDHK